jgi:hypothetical protein
MERVVYLHGLASSPASRKAALLGARLAVAGLKLEVPDLVRGDLATLTISSQLNVISGTCRGWCNRRGYGMACTMRSCRWTMRASLPPGRRKRA